MPNIELALVICNQGPDRENVVTALLKCGLNPICCENVREARNLMAQQTFEVVVCRDILSDGDFRAVIRAAGESNVHTPVVVLLYASDWDSYLKSLGAGAFDCIVCPLDPTEARRIIWSVIADSGRPEKPVLTAS